MVYISSLRIEERSPSQGYALAVDYVILIPVRAQNFSENGVDLLPNSEYFLDKLYYRNLLMEDNIITGGFNDLI